MATETPAAAAGRPRAWLLILFGIVLVAFLGSKMFSGVSRPAPVSSTGPRAAGATPADQIDPAELDVKIEALTQAPAGPADGSRNPFRFKPKPPPPAPPSQPMQAPAPMPMPVQPPVPVGPPPPPPIGNLIKFIGIVDTGSEKIGAFSDCRYTFSGREGEIIEGRFRVVRIGVESAILEYADGRGRTTVPLNGQACVK